MEIFGQVYKENNLESNITSSGAYTLSYALMQLHTSLHNNNKKLFSFAMSKKDFFKNLQGIKDLENLT